MMTPNPLPRRKARNRLWFERLMAILALINYLLVLFDLSYIPLHNFWQQGRVQLLLHIGSLDREIPAKPLQVLPIPIAPGYDWVKGIEPYRATQEYLKQVNELESALNQKALLPQDNALINSKIQDQKIAAVLQKLRQSSREMIETNPFQSAHKTGTLERIKNIMREHIFGTNQVSAKKAFDVFWSQEYLARQGYSQELNFFNNQIKPLIETNYYRPVDESGEPVDYFALLDFPFFLIFLFEFLVRTWSISRQHKGIRWLDAMLWRWYDVFLLIPVFRWLRIIPVVIRLHQAQLINLKAIQNQVSQGFVASIAGDMTEVIVLNLVNQIQDSIQAGAIREFISQREKHTYIVLNNQNETSEIIRLLANTIINKVLPNVQSDLDLLLSYSIETAIAQTSAYRTLKNVPGLQELQTQLIQTLTRELCQTLLETLQGLIESDSKFYDLAESLIDQFRRSLTQELGTQNSLSRIEELVIDLLEEVKVNYIQRLSHEDIEDILEQNRILKEKLPANSPRAIADLPPPQE
jgi:hypothetical protein